MPSNGSTTALTTWMTNAGYDPVTPLAVGIGGRDGMLWSAATGVLPDGRPMTAATTVYAASLAKQVVGACCALLVADERLDPDDALGEWLPELPAWAASVRLRHLLHHTSGLPDEPELVERLRSGGASTRTTETTLAALSTFPSLEMSAGTEARYCNAGYVCLGRVIERAAGVPFPEFAHSQLFAPLGMAATRFWQGSAPFPPGAAPVRADAAGYWPHSLGDGGMWTTVADLLRWNSALLADGLGISAVLHTPGVLNDGTPLDYGWGVGLRTHAGQIAHSHGGSWPGVTARLVRLPRAGRSVAVLALDDDGERIVRLSAHLLDAALTGEWATAPDGETDSGTPGSQR